MSNGLRLILPAILACALAGCVGPRRTPGPENLTTAKEAVKVYYEAGDYGRDVAAVAAKAAKWLTKRAAGARPEERLAVVFDIDETVLSNYLHMKSQDFGYVPEVWNGWVDAAEAPAIKPMRELVGRARELDYTVFFITGRMEPREHAGTSANLMREGMGDYDRLIMKPEGNKETAAVRKAAQRAALEAEGYVIVASIGDQWSDFAGGHTEKGFKVPNPFYEVP